MNRKKCIDDLKYIRKALSADTIYQDVDYRHADWILGRRRNTGS